MAIVYLVRHAQASFGAQNYDCLSELGRQQSRWLGEHFAARGLAFSRVLAGTLVRQQDTARELLGAMGAGTAPVVTHPGLDEYQAEALYAAHTGGADPRAHQRADYRDYWRTLRAAMLAWTRDELAGVPETWSQFGARMADALSRAVEGTGRDDHVLVVSSGGAIARGMIDVLGCPAAVSIELNLQFRNTAYCELVAAGGALRMISFNTLPHLEHPQRRHAITAT